MDKTYSGKMDEFGRTVIETKKLAQEVSQNYKGFCFQLDEKEKRIKKSEELQE